MTDDVLLIQQICGIYPCVLFPPDLGFYRVHSTQINAGLTLDRAMAEKARYAPEIILSAKCPLAEQERLQAYRNVVGPFARYCIRLALCGRLVRAIRLWCYARRPLRDLGLAVLHPKRPYPPCI